MNECVICMEQFVTGSHIIRIPACQHFFHNKCIKNWFDVKITDDLSRLPTELIILCPFCNLEINLNEESCNVDELQNEEKPERILQEIIALPKIDKKCYKNHTMEILVTNPYHDLPSFDCDRCDL